MKKYLPKYAGIGIGLFIAAFITALVIFSIQLSKNQKLETEISKMISGEVFSEVEYDSYKDTLIEYSKKNISKAALGTVYNRLSLMCQQEGDWLGYYSNFGKSAYYLEESGNYNDEINLYCDLVYYVYFAHGNFDLAATTMEKVNSLAQKSEDLNTMMESLVSQRNALLAYYLDDYETAVIEADKVKKILADVNEVYAPGFINAADFIIAKTDIEQNNYNLAEEIVETQKNSEVFEFGDTFSMMNTNFIIPYYQMLAYVSAHNGDEEQVRRCLTQITQRASDYDFEYAVYDTLKILRRHNSFSAELTEWINEQELSIYKHFINEKSRFYTAICNALIDTNYKETLTTEIERRNNLRQVNLIIALILFLILFATSVFILRKRLYTDALTLVRNRRAFDLALKRNIRTQTDYAVIMMDIDDFKKVNDTFGHEEGDNVLRKLGSILLEREEPRKIVPYRYGGEEFAILVYDNYISKGKEIAESLRYQFECQIWEKEGRLTISGGFAPTVDQADKNLYIAKNNGKNQVV